MSVAWNFRPGASGRWTDAELHSHRCLGLRTDPAIAETCRQEWGKQRPLATDIVGFIAEGREIREAAVTRLLASPARPHP